jgi:hypothetical protein
MTRNGAKATKHRARDLAVKASRGDRAARVKGGALKAGEVSCQNNLRRGAWITDVTYGTGG